MEKVSVNKGVLIGLLAVSASSLLALVFLLGRTYGSRPPSGQPERGDGQDRLAILSGPKPRATDPPPPVPTMAGTPVERGDVTSDSTRADVAAYLRAVDQIQPEKMSGDAEGVATELAASLAKGDMSGLDEMIRQVESARERLATLTPPAPYAAFHGESLRNLDDAAEMLRSLRMAMESPEPASLLEVVSTRAATLRSRSEALQKEDMALRQRYGLSH